MRGVKRLTLNQIARSTLRVNKKAYVSLFLGILLAVYLATATSLCAWGTIRGHEEQMAEKVGWMDMFLLGNGGATDEKIRSTGYFREIGHVTVDATVEDTSICTGYYDETAEKLMNRKLTEGRMPEKAGEIAAERSALIRLGLDKTASVGGTITLKMHPISGVTEEKTFTLVGILNEQTNNLETYNEGEGMRFPAMLVSPDETYEVGGVLVHRVLTYAPLITFNQVLRHIPQGLEDAIGVSRETGTTVYYDSGWDRIHRTIERILIWAILGAALMLSACVGITSAMESVLAQKTQDIGMLRAIGATRRQIRRVYGSEAWLLAATALPAGMGLGVLTAWIISRIAPDQVVFALNAWLLIPILALSALCVFAASRLPLYRASRQMPMGVLRDTAMLRKTGKMRSQNTFTPTRLIARRRAGLHPFRMLGAAGMTALTLACALLLGELVLGLRTTDAEDQPAFRIYGSVGMYSDPFSQMNENEIISRAELRSIEDIDGVSRITTLTMINANLVMDEVPEYFRTYRFNVEYENGETSFSTVSTLEHGVELTADWLFYTNEDLADARARMYTDWEAALGVQYTEQADMIRSILGISGRIVPVSVYVADIDPDALQEYVTDGSIDMDRLDSGEQVLVYAPVLCARKHAGGGMEFDKWLMPNEAKESEWDLIVRNDAFSAGMRLNLLELAGRMPDGGYYWDETDEEMQRAHFQDAEAVQAYVTIGAVLSGPLQINEMHMSGFTVIVTEKGAAAMGLELPNPGFTDIYTTANLTREQETEIEEAINQVAVKGWLGVENELEITRAYMNKKLRQMLLFAGLILLFFAVSVFMQVSAASRQIRSDTRTIGTLRAVGANLKTLTGCYRLPAWIAAVIGMILPVLFYLFCEVTGVRLFTKQHPLLMIPVLAAMAACIALACTAGIRNRLAAATRQSIVENIREL